MSKPLQTGLLISVVVVALVALGFFVMRESGTSSSGGVWTDEQRIVRDALEKVGNDPSKLSPDMKRRYDKIIEENPFTRKDATAPGIPPPGSPPSQPQ